MVCIMKKSLFIKISYYFLILILIFLFQSFASKIAGIIAGAFDYSGFDKNNLFMYISIHHIIQMLIALIFIFIFLHFKKVDFYLRPKVDKYGIIACLIFTVVILIYVILSYTIGYKLNIISPYSYELNFINVFGTLAFQLFLSGLSEEILFRALPITILKTFLNRNSKSSCFLCVFVSSILFALAHIRWTLFPFTISYSLFQLIYAFILGLAYGYTYLKSKSVIYPIIMHAISNFLMVGIGYIFACFII